MHRQKLHEALIGREDEYKQKHKQTIDIDLRITEALSKGFSITKVSIDIPCDISTVYRSIDRVERFLKGESDEEIDLMEKSYIVDDAFVMGKWSHRSARGMDLHALLIILHQLGRNCIKGSEMKRYLPGLRNKKQRDTLLSELNNLTVLTDEDEPKHIKIFEFVKYEDRYYFFELTEEAYPYYYPLYRLLGRHPQFPNLCK